MPYCASRSLSLRRLTREVKIGSVGVGADNPIRIQSMTTTDTEDVDATVRQSIALAEVGCEIVRVTAPNLQAARSLAAIRRELSAAGFSHVPLVADIHFLPAAAMEAVEHVEKIRINPGNYADKKKFAVHEYSDSDYERELQRLDQALAPLLKRCRELGRALRIGTNHGSLSDRIMNRYGDTPLGMVESALEFLRIAEAHSFKQIVLSMKASNPKVMIEAYRLLVERMDREDMHYPLHLGVTEAGDGEDGRIKGAIGIGSLLLDGLGDTLRVSLTEDSVHEIPVAQALAAKATALWNAAPRDNSVSAFHDSIDPFRYARRPVAPVALGPSGQVGLALPPRVIVRVPAVRDFAAVADQLSTGKFADTPAEGLLASVDSAKELPAAAAARTAVPGPRFLALEIGPGLSLADLQPGLGTSGAPLLLVRSLHEADDLEAWVHFVRKSGYTLACQIAPADFASLRPALARLGPDCLVFTLPGLSGKTAGAHTVGAYRELAEQLRALGFASPLWIRNTVDSAVRHGPDFLSRLLEASILTGALLCDGLGDYVSVETETDPARATTLAYNLLQGAGARVCKTEFVACPSCGRTLFDLQTTTRRIREKTGHLKGVKLAIMGCIVNGPGEMADADFGYVGGAPGKINLYVGKACVQYNIPQAEADDRLIALIKQHGKWVDPTPAP